MQSSTTPTTFVDQASTIFAHHPHLSHRKVKCRAEANCAIIEGEVHSFYEKQLAQEALREVKGIEKVENQLDVVSTYKTNS